MPEDDGEPLNPFIVDLDGFEGPLDVLVDLARAQKVDLAKISVLALVEQYLNYLRDARHGELRVAAEYLVMAAWLAYLKSQLLLPKEEREEEDVESMAEQLTARLKIVDVLRRAADDLMARPLLGQDRLVRGAPEEPEVVTTYRVTARLGGLITAYSSLMTRQKKGSLVVEPRKVMSVEAALERLSTLLTGDGWQRLERFLPADLRPGLHYRSAVSAALLAGLELGKQGVVDIEQDEPFGPIRLRRIENQGDDTKMRPEDE